LKTAIQDYTENAETSFVTHLATIIRNVEDLILFTLDLDFFRKNVSGNMTSGNRYLAKPADYLACYGMMITVSSRQEMLLLKDVGYVVELNVTSGVPKAFAPYDITNFIIGPTPNSNYAVELHYLYRPTSLTDSGEGGTTWVSNNAQMPLLYGCLRDAYVYMKGEADLIQLYDKLFTESLSRLKDYAESRENTDGNRVGLPMKART